MLPSREAIWHERLERGMRRTFADAAYREFVDALLEVCADPSLDVEQRKARGEELTDQYAVERLGIGPRPR